MKARKYLWFSILLAMAITLLILLPRLTQPYSTEDDFRNWYWMHRFQDSELFVQDQWINDNVLELNLGPIRLVTLENSPLYGIMFQALSYLLPVVLAGKLLVFPLTLIAVYYLYGICRKFTKPQTSFVISIIFVLMNLSLTSMISTVGGFQRSFAFPLLLAFLFYSLEERPAATFGVMLISGALYPPLFLLLTVTYGLELVSSWWSDRHTETGRRYGLQLVGILSVGIIIMLLLLPVLQEQLGRINEVNVAANWQAMFDATQFGPGGRVRMFLIFPFVGRGGIADHGITILVIMFLALFGTAISIWQPQRLRTFPRVFKSLFWASWTTFLAAWAVFLPTATFLLYLPSRYTQSSLVLVPFIFVMIHGRDTVQAAAKGIAARTASLIWVGLPLSLVLLAVFFWLPEPEPRTVAFGRGTTRWTLLAAAVIILVLTVLLRLRSTASRNRDRSISPRLKMIAGAILLLIGIAITGALQPFLTYYVATQPELAMYEYLQTLPKDVMLAGDPVTLDAVPLFGKRKALFTRGRIHRDNKLVNETLLAYYAESGQEIVAYCETYGVDYLVVNQDDFENLDAEDHRYFYEPYHSTVAPIIDRRSTFVLKRVPDAAKIFEQGNLSVVPCTTDALVP